MSRQQLIASVAAALSLSLQAATFGDLPPEASKIVDKATRTLEKNLNAFHEANEEPIAEACNELQKLADRLLAANRNAEGNAVLGQIQTLEDDLMQELDFPPPLPKNAVNLLKGLNIQAGNKGGQWRQQGQRLLGGGPNISKFEFDNQNALNVAANDYDLAMRFSITPDQNGFSDIILDLPGVPALLTLRNHMLKDANASKVFFMHDQQPVGDINRFQPNVVYAVKVCVRDKGNAVSVFINENQVFNRIGCANKPVPKNFGIGLSPGAGFRLVRFAVSQPQPGRGG